MYPSRARFARGFAWDEGFHLLLLAEWDPILACEIMTGWFYTMDEDGYMPTEQVRGMQQEQFLRREDIILVQEKDLKPPSFILAIKVLLKSEDPTVTDYLKKLYNHVVKWHGFYNKRSKNPSLPCTYSFKDREANENV